MKKIPELRPNAQLMAQNKPSSFKDQFAALKHIPALFRLIWQTNRWLMLTNLSLRLVRSSLPVITLFIAKNIVDEVVRLSQSHAVKELTFNAFFTEGSWLLTLILNELGVVALSEIIGRGISLTEILLGDFEYFFRFDIARNDQCGIIRHIITRLNQAHFIGRRRQNRFARTERIFAGRVFVIKFVFERAV